MMEESPDLKKAIKEQDWEETARILKNHPELAKEELSKYECDVLWKDAPLETIRVLLGARAFQNVVTAEDVKNACKKDAPLDIFKFMLEQQPSIPLEYPFITFNLIEKGKLEHFRAVFEHCSAATELKSQLLHLTPLLLLFQKKRKINSDWIEPVLKANPNAAKQKDFDGKTALHLAYQHGVSAEILRMIQQACPDAENIRDNLGRLPKDLANQSDKDLFTPVIETLILGDKLNFKKKSYPDNAVVVCRGDMLIRDPQLVQNKEDKDISRDYAKQVLARHRIFGTLLNEFSKMVGIDEKDVIQKAAVIQALTVQDLSNGDGTIINFGMFDNPGYWYQQEVLKLVMRVYHEAQSKLDETHPSILGDGVFCVRQLDDRENGKNSFEASNEDVKAYNELIRWLTEGFDNSSLYSLQGPVLKPLQSLFNKLFIRRGQTSVHVIGDMVRGTLLLDNKTMLDEVVKRIEGKFPNITENKFRHPDRCTGLADFLYYVHDDLIVLPDSDVLPYRFKANSSQKKKEEPLWYNLNFFLQVPEYHRVGFSDMFVACELQIGVEEEINKHRNVHDAYERDRILSNQPLLKNYDVMSKEEEGEDKFSQLVNCTEDDNQMIETVLFGKIATEVLVPCTTAGTDNKSNVLLFENGPFSLSEDETEADSFVKPERLCLNNRSLNWFALNCPKQNKFGSMCAAMVVAGPYKLEGTKWYFVNSFVFKRLHSEGFQGTIGLYARVGPYLIQIACAYLSRHEIGDIVVVKSGRNFYYLEQACPAPVGTTALEVIVYGEISEGGEFGYEEMKLSLKVFDVY